MASQQEGGHVSRPGGPFVAILLERNYDETDPFLGVADFGSTPQSKPGYMEVSKG